MKRLLNFLSYQAVWLAAVLGAARGVVWAGPVALAAFVAWQLPTTRMPHRDLGAAGYAALLGFGYDSLLAGTGLVRYSSPWPHPAVAPVWILALWAGFALTLSHSLRWLQGRPVMGAALGAVGGPLAYLAGEALGAVDFDARRTLTLSVLAAGWGVLTPTLVRIAARESSPAVWEVS